MDIFEILRIKNDIQGEIQRALDIDFYCDINDGCIDEKWAINGSSIYWEPVDNKLWPWHYSEEIKEVWRRPEQGAILLELHNCMGFDEFKLFRLENEIDYETD